MQGRCLQNCAASWNRITTHAMQGRCLQNCAASWNRTNDPLLKREMLYQLSYSRIYLNSKQTCILAIMFWAYQNSYSRMAKTIAYITKKAIYIMKNDLSLYFALFIILHERIEQIIDETIVISEFK